jgi:cobalt-zinc-cadmium resistance protein CzcA
MVRKLVAWSLDNPIVVILLAVALAFVGVFSFLNVNVEVYPDPAPAIVEVVAQMPGASAEEVERQVTIPLEITFAGMPGLKNIRSQSLCGLSDLKMSWHYGSQFTYEFARQEVINRMSTISQPLPPNVTPGISPESPTGEIYRYILRVPKVKVGGPTPVAAADQTLQRYNEFKMNGSWYREIYTLNDLKALQDWVLEREFRTVPRIVDVTSFGGTVRRYEVQPDPDRLRRYGVTLAQLQNALTNSNQTVGGDYVNQGEVALTVRSVGLFGGGVDPVNKVLAFGKKSLDEFETQALEEAYLGKTAPNDERQRVRAALLGRKVAPPLSADESAQVQSIRRVQDALSGSRVEPPLNAEEEGRVVAIKRIRNALARRSLNPPLTEDEKQRVETIDRVGALRASAILRAEEQRRCRDIRSLVIASVNNQPVRVEDIIEGGRIVSSGEPLGTRGVVVSHQTRLGRIGYWRADEKREPGSSKTLLDVGHDEDDKVQCIVLMRKNEDTVPALKDVKKKVAELNDPSYGRLLPGVELETYYDRTDLLHVTTETVTENLLVGVLLVVVILLMFLSNIKTALIVAINIPLALLFAYAVLFARGKSANLLSIGAVDFGIIVDSTVIIAENIYRNLSAGHWAELPIKARILHAVQEIDHALLFSTLIMMVAFMPLFTMSGAEGELFRPMAHTYAFSLGGALLLALTLTPVLCAIFFKHLKPERENLFVRTLKARYLSNLEMAVKYRWVTVILLALLISGTLCLLPSLGREFMPELEEGNLWIRGTLPLNTTLERQAAVSKSARAIMAAYPEVEAIVAQLGRPDDGTDAAGFYNSEYFVPLRPEKDWPKIVDQTGWRRWIWGDKRTRAKAELVKAMNAELEAKVPGVTWNFSQNIRDNVMEALSGVKGDNCVKIFGPDIDQLELLAARVKNALQDVQGIENVGIFHVKGQSHLEARVDPQKCERWGVMTADVNNVVSSALGARALSSMVEGEKLFDIAVRWPKRLRNNESSILDIPVDIVNNQVVVNQYPGTGAGSVATPNPKGYATQDPAAPGTLFNTANPISSTAPRLRLKDLMSPVAEDGSVDPDGQLERAGASDIYRENGKRMIAVKFGVRNRDLASAVEEAKESTQALVQPPYRAVWSGEFEQMEDANTRLLFIIPASLLGIFILLYMAFRSLLDSVVVLSNVVALTVGGMWALLLTGTNFSISAAVGFVSLFGVAIMDGLLLIASFNQGRAQGLSLHDAIMQGAEKRVRPVTMTALTAILGLLPAALSTRIGSQTQRPLAIVVVGGMLTTLFLTRYLMPVLYSFYGHREPPAGGGGLAH